MLTPSIGLVVNGIRLTKLKMPASITAAMESHAKLETASKAWTANYTDLVRAWSKSILADTDPLDDPDVQKQAIAHLLNTQGLEHTTRTIAEELTRDAITEHIDKILAAFKDTVEEAAATLTSAHELLGDRALDDTSVIVTLGSIAVRKHADATDAIRTIRILDKSWGSLAALTQFASPSTAFIDRFADVDLDTWERLRNTKDAWELIRAGATIDLATTRTEVARRTQRHQDEREGRTRLGEDAFKNQFKTFHGTPAQV